MRTGCHRPSSAPRATQGAESNHKKPAGEPGDRAAGAQVADRVTDREALGRSRGGLTSKIHLAADSRCRVLARITSAGQRHDSLGYAPVMDADPDPPSGSGPATQASGSGSGRQGVLQQGDPGRPAPTWHHGDHPRTGRPDPQPHAPAAPRAGGPRPSTRPPTHGATSSNAPSTGSSSTGPWPPATTSATSFGEEPLMSPPSGSGSATQSHDLRDTP